MQKLILHASALIGLVIFLKQAWTYAPLDRALLTSIGTGLAIYLVLFLGTILIRRIAAHTPPHSENDEPDEQSRGSSPSPAQQSEQSEPAASDADSRSESPNPAEQESSTDPVAAPMA